MKNLNFDLINSYKSSKATVPAAALSEEELIFTIHMEFEMGVSSGVPDEETRLIISAGLAGYEADIEQEESSPHEALQAFCHVQDVHVLSCDIEEDIENDREHQENAICFVGSATADALIGVRAKMFTPEPPQQNHIDKISVHTAYANKIASAWTSHLTTENNLENEQGRVAIQYAVIIQSSTGVENINLTIRFLRCQSTTAQLKELMSHPSGREFVASFSAGGEPMSSILASAACLGGESTPLVNSSLSSEMSRQATFEKFCIAAVPEIKLQGTQDKTMLQDILGNFAKDNNSSTLNDSKAQDAATNGDEPLARKGSAFRTEGQPQVHDNGRSQNLAALVKDAAQPNIHKDAIDMQFSGKQAANDEDAWQSFISNSVSREIIEKEAIRVTANFLPGSVPEHVARILSDTTGQKLAEYMILGCLSGGFVMPTGEVGEGVFRRAIKLEANALGLTIDGISDARTINRTAPADITTSDPGHNYQIKWANGKDSSFTLKSAQQNNPGDAVESLLSHLEENKNFLFLTNDESIKRIGGDPVPEGSVNRTRADLMHPELRDNLITKLKDLKAGAIDSNNKIFVEYEDHDIILANGAPKVYSLEIEYIPGKEFRISSLSRKKSSLAALTVDMPSGETLKSLEERKKYSPEFQNKFETVRSIL